MSVLAALGAVTWVALTLLATAGAVLVVAEAVLRARRLLGRRPW